MPRIEIVRTDADQPFHVRIRAANGEPLFTSEKYAERVDAANAIGAAAEVFGLRMSRPPTLTRNRLGYIAEDLDGERVIVEIGDVDERDLDTADAAR